MDTFGKLIRTYRKDHGWKQQELADRWGFTRAYVSQIERGVRRLDNPDHVKRLVDILGISEREVLATGKSLPPIETGGSQLPLPTPSPDHQRRQMLGALKNMQRIINDLIAGLESD